MSGRELVASAIASAVAEIITLPICTTKTWHQNTRGTFTSTATGLYRAHGVRGFYRASIPAILSQVLSTSCKYTLYRWFTTYTDNRVLCGVVSSALVSLITHPIDVVRVHMQMQTRCPPRVFYLGYSKTLGKVCIAGALYLPLYDHTCDMTDSKTTAALVTAVTATTIIHPLDYLKTRQIYGLPMHSGLLTYYRGLGLNLARIVPHFTIMMWTIEQLRA